MSSLPPPSPTPESLPPIVTPPQKAPGEPPVARGPKQEDKNAVLHSRPMILGLLFGVTAILGLPLLWYSPVFSRQEKFWWSVAITFYTLVLLLIAAAAWLVVYNAWTQGQLSL